MTRPLGMCGACREADCECCDLLVWGGRCGCGCLSPAEAMLVPFGGTPLIFVAAPRRPRPPKQQPRSHCQRGHPLAGGNVYLEPGSTKRRCRTCRRASWRQAQYRKQMGEVT